MMNLIEVNEWLLALFLNTGLSKSAAGGCTVMVLVVALLIFAYLLAIVAKKLGRLILSSISAKTKSLFDDFLVHNKTVNYLSRIVPLLFVYNLIPEVFYYRPNLIKTAMLFADAYLAIWAVWLLRSFLYALRDWLRTKEAFKDKPIDSFIQVINVVAYIFAAVTIFSLFSGKPVMTFITAMGAASAIILLIFKDTILGFVASIQVSANDMVRIGDWITMEKYGADGDVIEINLATVKVQNFDKTITTIPTYYLISDSFKNWRGMQKSGGRRIKRSIRIKVSSIRFLQAEELDQLKKIGLITSYLTTRSAEIAQYNSGNGVDSSLPINGRSLTNIGVYREYINQYVKKNQHVHQNMTMMVRQLEPSKDGLPIELYVFTNDTRWVNYEHVMADLFDHLLAAIPYFKLEVFELPSSGDVRFFASKS